MKRRVVAIVLSLTLCMGGTLEAGAAALGSAQVQAAETGTDVTADSFGDEAETVQQPQTEEEQTDTAEEDGTVDISGDTVETPDITETPDVTETPDITETPDMTETPEADTTTPADEFSAGEVQELEDPSVEDAKTQNTDDGATAAAVSEGAEIVDGVVIAKSDDWESDSMGFRLLKKTTSDDVLPAAESEIRQKNRRTAARKKLRQPFPRMQLTAVIQQIQQKQQKQKIHRRLYSRKFQQKQLKRPKMLQLKIWLWIMVKQQRQQNLIQPLQLRKRVILHPQMVF